MLSEEEQNAVELLTKKVDDWNCKRPKNPLIFTEIVNEIDKDNNAIKTVLNLITKLQKENEYWKNGFERELEDNRKNICELLKQDLILREKDKQIDLMADYISKIDIEEDICMKNKTNPDWCNEDYTNCKDCIKSHFEKLAKEKDTTKM